MTRAPILRYALAVTNRQSWSLLRSREGLTIANDVELWNFSNSDEIPASSSVAPDAAAAGLDDLILQQLGTQALGFLEDREAICRIC